MWTRDRWLDIAEMCGFAAIALAVGLMAYAYAGLIEGLAAFLLVGGAEAIYLANAYAVPSRRAVAPEGPPDA